MVPAVTFELYWLYPVLLLLVVLVFAGMACGVVVWYTGFDALCETVLVGYGSTRTVEPRMLIVRRLINACASCGVRIVTVACPSWLLMFIFTAMPYISRCRWISAYWQPYGILLKITVDIVVESSVHFQQIDVIIINEKRNIKITQKTNIKFKNFFYTKIYITE